MNSKYKYLSQNILLFSISGLVPKALSFLMVPFYTSVLTPTDYGYASGAYFYTGYPGCGYAVCS